MPGKSLLLFQTDSLLLKANGVDPFVRAGWDYVGAPWVGGNVGNGGLSLRNRAAMVSIAHAWPDESLLNEDLYFTHLATFAGFRIPPAALARNFSVEFDEGTPRGSDPAGAHQLTDLVVSTRPWGTYAALKATYLRRLEHARAAGARSGHAGRGPARGVG